MQKQFLIHNQTVALRDPLPADVDAYLRWQTHGEWRAYDAPWEDTDVPLTKKQQTAYKAQFAEINTQTLPTPRQRATISTPDNTPIGWVNHHQMERFPDVCYIGIDICEDDYLNKGFGTQALKLWVAYLFEHADFVKIGLNTWSFNPRMIHVAEKLSFTYEGRQRELIEWQGYRLDLMHFGILRTEWAKISNQP